jgi:hypothetical protein
MGGASHLRVRAYVFGLRAARIRQPKAARRLAARGTSNRTHGLDRPEAVGSTSN